MRYARQYGIAIAGSASTAGVGFHCQVATLTILRVASEVRISFPTCELFAENVTSLGQTRGTGA
jgi:hypothetical protein